MIPLWMAPLAIATGNAFILKPPTRDPSAAVRIAELWSEAGLPDGVFSVVHGNRNAISRLLTHPDIAAVSFVGSTSTARHIFDVATKHGKRCQALGAAKNHGIVLADANLEHAASNLVAAAFGSAGERCMAMPVALIEESIADEFIKLLVEKTKAVKLRPGTDLEADLGAIITPEARDRIVSLITSAEQEGAEILVDGRGAVPEGYENGNWVGPTLIDKVTTDMTINKEEVFGPTLEIIRIPDLAAGIKTIQANPYGNGTAIFTSSGEAARTFARAPRTAGMVGVNIPIPVPIAWHSFGGWKESLVGESSIYGPEGVKFYTHAKVVTQTWPHRDHARAISFHFSGDAQK
jgi:malonate-semialdehyde dehydrogenase (acetylating)/methylmalonate-semialdehyde dehydrogenase